MSALDASDTTIVALLRGASKARINAVPTPRTAMLAINKEPRPRSLSVSCGLIDQGPEVRWSDSSVCVAFTAIEMIILQRFELRMTIAKGLLVT